MRVCENAVALGCDMLMSAPGQISGPIPAAIKFLREAGDIAAEYKLKLAIEFNSQHDVLNSLAVLTELIEGAAKPNCGYLIDAYHFTRCGAGGRGFENVPADKIYCFQYSDLSPNPVTGVRRPTDRLPPGKGVIKWREMFGLLAEKGYTGYLSYEAPNPEQWARSPYDVAREGVELTKQIIARRSSYLRELRFPMAEELPLFLGLNDKTIIDIPKTVEKQRYMTSVAPKAANPGKWVEQPRMPIPTGEHAVIECQGKIHSVAGYAKHRVDQNFHQVFDPTTKTMVAEGALPAPVQPRRRRLDRHENLHLRRLRRAEPLPAFQVLRLRHRDRRVGADRADLAPARRHLGHRARRQDPFARRARRALGGMARGLRSGDQQILRPRQHARLDRHAAFRRPARPYGRRRGGRENPRHRRPHG